jgi:hypothetical protein
MAGLLNFRKKQCGNKEFWSSGRFNLIAHCSSAGKRPDSAAAAC